MPAILAYLLHFLTAAVMVVVFFVIYTRTTPFDEVQLIRQGNQAAALSLGGALVGFAFTIASALLHTTDYYAFAGWAAGALLAQLLVYAVATRLLHMSKDHIESNNKAFGCLLGSISLSIGLVNAGCIS